MAAVLPWVSVRGHLPLDLGLLGAEVTAGGRTVIGLETAAWPYLIGLAALAAVLAVLGVARNALCGLGVLTVVAGGVLIYYLANVVDIETSGRSSVERTAADLALSSSIGLGPYLLLASGVLITSSALPGPAVR